MKILYIANIRLPTEKAHGVAIMKMCEAFARAGAGVRLVVSRRYTSLAGDPHKVYGIQESFPVAYLPVVDLFPLLWVRRSVAFALESATFYTALFFWLILRTRKQILYTRDIGVLVFAFFGFRVAYECHAVSKWHRTFFFLARRAHKIVVISKALQDIFVRAGFNPKEVLVAPSGVDVVLFSSAVDKDAARKTLNIPAGRFVAVYTGAFTTMGADKGLYDVLEALCEAPDVHLVAAGGAPYDLERYNKRAAELGVAGRVSLVGYVPQKTLALYNAAADVLVAPFPDLPHYRHHMSPMKLIEYMASHRPVIATDLPTIREVIDERSAIIVPPGNPSALAGALLKLKNNPALGVQLAEAAFGQVHAYSWDERAKRILHTL